MLARNKIFHACFKKKSEQFKGRLSVRKYSECNFININMLRGYF